MSQSKTKENYYELLRVSSKASASEITAAYMTAKSAYSKDSIATYSIMGSEESTQALAEIEQAYATLINPARRHEYDKEMSSSHVINLDVTAEAPQHFSTEPIRQPDKSLPVSESPNPTVVTSHEQVGDYNLTQIRESHGYSMEDVSRITKIPIKYLKSIESYDTKTLPAKVYVQGFLKNLAHLYRLEPKKTVSSYFEQLEKLSGSISA